MATSICVRLFDQKKDTLIVWSFVNIFKPVCTIVELFEDIKNGKFSHVKLPSKSCSNLFVTSCRASTSSRLLEEISAAPNSDAIQKAKVFGMLYFTVFVEHCEHCNRCVEPPPPPRQLTAMQVLMSSARAQAKDLLPKTIESPKNKKEEQYNEILYLEKKNCRLESSAATTISKFMTKFSESLWYIDGHTDKIEHESSREFPPGFKILTGFNKPELTKHRKRDIANLLANKLEELSMSLKEAVNAMVFATSNEWSDFKMDCLKVAHL
eukprot:TCONS_00040673-protein